MTSDEHLAKAERILASLNKLAFPDDYLALVDGAMIAGYHLGNALLHGHGILPDTEHANTPSKLDRPISALPEPIQRAFHAFAELEQLRFDYVRSPSTYDERLSTATWRHLETMRQECRALLGLI
jgi:hypothetical protein